MQGALLSPRAVASRRRGSVDPRRASSRSRVQHAPTASSRVLAESHFVSCVTGAFVWSRPYRMSWMYFGGITMVSGAIIAGMGATEGLFPHAFDEWFGLSGTWALLVGGFAVIVTLIVNPEGIAGTGYKKKQQEKRRLAAGPAPSGGFAARLSRLRGAGMTTSAGGGEEQ